MKAAIFHPEEIKTLLEIIYQLYEIEKILGHPEDAAHYLETYENLKKRVIEK